jgi:hypothetical protein
MKALFLKARWLSMGVIVGLTMITLWAQEPQQFNRGINVVQGNVVTSRGYVLSSSPVRDIRTNTSISGVSQTYTAAQVLTGYITRTVLISNSTDVMPTAANLAAAIPGVQVGHSLWLMVDNTAPGATLTLNGASTGVTYADGCATAVSTSDSMLVLINFTSTTAYRVVCVNVNT